MLGFIPDLNPFSSFPALTTENTGQDVNIVPKLCLINLVSYLLGYFLVYASKNQRVDSDKFVIMIFDEEGVGKVNS
jgi:hypothetical protein